MNPNLFQRQYELMFQAYYQANVWASIFLQPTISYIPTPGLSPTLPGALAGTLRLTVLF
jgi:porin